MNGRASQTGADLPDAGTVRAAVLCLLKSGRIEEARSLVGRLSASDSAEAPGLCYVRAAVLAAAGREQEAYEELVRLRQRGSLESRAHALLLALAKRLALAEIRIKDIVAASERITMALSLSPEDGEAKTLARFVGEAIPLAHIRRGERSRAVEIWEEAWRRSPDNPRLWHRLALAYTFLAREIESRPGPQGAGQEPSAASRQVPSCLRHALSFWGALAACDSFWMDWVKQRAQEAKLNVQDLHQMAAGCRDATVNQIKTEIRKRRDRARQQNLGDLADLLEGLIVDLGAEVRSAACLRKAAETGAGARKLPAMGAMGLDRLGLIEKARALSREMNPRENPWSLFLDGSGRVLVAVEEGLPETAWRQARGRKEPALIAHAAGAHATELSSRGLQKEAFAVLQEAKKLGAFGAAEIAGVPAADLEDTVARLAEEAVKGYQKQVARLEREATKRADKANGEDAVLPVLDEGLETLKLAVALSGRASRSLAQLLVSKAAHQERLAGVQLEEEKKRDSRRMQKPLSKLFEEAVAVARQAVQAAPGYPAAAQCLSRLLTNKGIHEWNRDKKKGGMDLLKEALGADPHYAYARRNLGLMLKETAIGTWNEQNPYDASREKCRKALSIMAEAVRTCRTSSEVREPAVELLKAASFISSTPEFNELLRELQKDAD